MNNEKIEYVAPELLDYSFVVAEGALPTSCFINCMSDELCSDSSSYEI